MFCTECGKANPETAKFCRSCGAATGAEASEIPEAVHIGKPAAAPSSPQPELRKFDTCFRAGYRAVSCALLLFWLLMWLSVPSVPHDDFISFLAVMPFYGLSQLAFYLCLLPTRLAIRRKRPDRMLIFAFNILLGWTLVGWVGSLRWALKGNRGNLGKPEAQNWLSEFDELFDVSCKWMFAVAFLLFLPVYIRPSLFPYYTPDAHNAPEVHRLMAFILWVLVEVGLYLYLLPARLAIRRKRPNRLLIFAFNVLLGWTLVAWAVSLSRALTSKDVAG